MTISELIERLERLRAEHGDIEVRYWNVEYDRSYEDIDDVFFTPEEVERGVTNFVINGKPESRPWEHRDPAHIVIR